MKIPNKQHKKIITKTLAGLLAGVFVFVNTFGWAQEERLFPTGIGNDAFSSGPASKLAPPIRLPKKKFQEDFKAKAFLLAHKAVNKYIKERIEKDKAIWKKNWKRKRTEKVNINDMQKRGNVFHKIKTFDHVRFVKITGLLSHTGQFAHVGFTEKDDSGEPLKNATPVVYVDTRFYLKYKDIIQKHEIDEIVQWENFRANELDGVDRNQMRTWVKENIKAAKIKSKNFHKNSHPLDALYNRIDFKKTYFNYGYLNSLFQYAGLDKDDMKDVNVSGGGQNAKTVFKRARWRTRRGRQIKRDGLADLLFYTTTVKPRRKYEMVVRDPFGVSNLIQILRGEAQEVLNVTPSLEFEVELEDAVAKLVESGISAEKIEAWKQTLFESGDEMVKLASVPERISVKGKKLRVVPLTKELLIENKTEFTSLVNLIAADVEPFTDDDIVKRADNLSKFNPEFSFAVLGENEDPVALVFMTTSEELDLIFLSKIAVDPKFQGTAVASWILYKAFHYAYENYGILNAHWIATALPDG